MTRMRRAVTLVELLVVVVVAGILLAVTLPTVKYSIDSSKLREGTRLISAALTSAKADALASGLPAGVILDLEPVGDPAAPSGYQCTQIYKAQVPAPYCGDYQDARCTLSGSGPWQINFGPSAASLATLVNAGEVFLIRFDHKGRWHRARRSASGYEVLAGQYPSMAPFPKAYQIRRQARRTGQALELPQGIVIDLAASGLGVTGSDLGSASKQVLVLFDVATVAVAVDGLLPDAGTSKVYLLVGRTENVGQGFADSNLASGEAFWVTVNRRTGSIGTIQNTPDHNLPFGPNYLAAAREYAAAHEVAGGQ
jgi:prepilin-type N-terminal cleavage/methylation domain-containing protein